MATNALNYFTPQGQLVNSLAQMSAITGQNPLNIPSNTYVPVTPSVSVAKSFNVNNSLIGIPSIPEAKTSVFPVATVAPSRSSFNLSETLSGVTDLLRTGVQTYNDIRGIFAPPATTNVPSVIQPVNNPVVGAYIPKQGEGQIRPFDSSNTIYLQTPTTTQGSQLLPIQQGGFDGNALLIGGALLLAVMVLMRK